MRSARAIVAGLVVQWLVSLASQWLLFGFSRPQYWTSLQHYGAAISVIVGAGLGAAIVARLAPRRSLLHAIACLLLPIVGVQDEWAVGDPQFAIGIALGTLVALWVGVAIGAGRPIEDGAH